MSQVLTKTESCVREAWGMVERADPGDSLSVGVALDYVMDNLGVEREQAKLELYLHCARRVVLTTEPDWSAPDAHTVWAGMRHPDRTGDTFHCDRFPGVEFVLPSGSEDGQVGSASEHQSYP